MSATTIDNDTTQTGGTAVRPEIQGLRAIAAMAVVLFHLWPKIVPGGYVGVDVFFVISGFLITSLLLREAEGTGRVSLGRFYSRRAWRLLPMAFFIILIVIAFTPVFLPPSQWKGTALESVASGFYFENWWLAAQSVDYLGSEDAPSAVQHYWSLSVEEQFYIVWPSLIIASLWLSRKLRTPPRDILGVIVIFVSLLSLIASVRLARNGAPEGYFFTQTRVWELGLGAILSVFTPSLSEAWRRLAGFSGVAAIVAAIFFFSADTPFPGYAALLPTIGAALIIFSGATSDFFSAYSLLKTRLFQWLGDISYSVYLWHWPLVIFYRMSGNDRIGLLDGVIILAATLGLSQLSKRYIEDRFRHPATTSSRWRLFVPFAALVLTIIPVWAFSYHQVMNERASIAASPQNYPGALVLLPAVHAPATTQFSPPLAYLRFDKTPAYDNGCHLSFAATEPVLCQYGDPKGALKVFLIGDSHAANWIPALEVIAKRRHWNAISLTKSSCALMPAMLSKTGRPYEACLMWGRRVMEILKRSHPDLVILTHMRAAQLYASPDSNARPSMDATLVSLWLKIEGYGARVAIIADTPQWPRDPDVCLFKDRACKLKLNSTHDGDALFAAARENQSVTLVDLNEYLCPADVCPAVIGNVIVWRDRHHVTATYARTLAPILEKRLDAVLSRPRAFPVPVIHGN